MSSRRAKLTLLAFVLAGTVFQIGSCITQNLFHLAGVAALDIFLGPLLGDPCTILNPSACQN